MLRLCQVKIDFYAAFVDAKRVFARGFSLLVIYPITKRYTAARQDEIRSSRLSDQSIKGAYTESLGIGPERM